MKAGFDEMRGRDGGGARALPAATTAGSRSSRREVMRARREEAEVIFRRVGITFAVYGAKDEAPAATAAPSG